MNKKLLFPIAIIVGLAAIGFVGYRFLVPPAAPPEVPLEPVAHVDAKLETGAADALTPAPLRAAKESSAAHLTRAGVIAITNAQRRTAGTAPLAEDAKLDAAADAKLQDLFAKQYFEHVSPSGVTPADLAKGAGYEYVIVGENLALGNFGNDAELVQAWMDSPGHRANILFTRYTQIGVAVGRGTYEGRSTWIAVQEFGRPGSACPPLDGSLRERVQADEATIDQLVKDAAAKKSDIEAHPATRSEADAGYDPIDEYNALIRQINALNGRIEDEVTAYNEGVRAYNACANAA